MRLSNEIYEDIKQHAINVLIETDTRSIPIDPFELANKLGLHVIPYSAYPLDVQEELLFKNEDGFSIYSGFEDWTIYYNDIAKYERIRFTITHEIGHYDLGHFKGNEIEESESDFFAGYLLASPPLVHSILENPTPHSISNAFGLSRQASENAYYRYKKWLNVSDSYKEYEIRLLKQFKIRIRKK